MIGPLTGAVLDNIIASTGYVVGDVGRLDQAADNGPGGNATYQIIAVDGSGAPTLFIITNGGSGYDDSLGSSELGSTPTSGAGNGFTWDLTSVGGGGGGGGGTGYGNFSFGG